MTTRDPPYSYIPSGGEEERISKINTLFKMFDIEAHAYIRTVPQYWPEPVWILLDKKRMNAFDTLEQLERASGNLIQTERGTNVDL